MEFCCFADRIRRILGFEINRNDARILRLFVSDKQNYTFKKDGLRRDTKLTKYFVDSGISLPVRYVAQWNEGANAWIAILNDELCPSSLVNTLKLAQRKRIPQ